MTNRSMLVLLPNWVGDAVMATPLVRTLHELLPEAPLYVAGPPHVVGMFRSHPGVTGSIALTAPPAGHWWYLPTALRRIRARAEALASCDPRIAMVVPGSFGAALATWLSGCPERCGYAREGRGLLLTRTLPHPDDFRMRHRVRYFLDLARLVDERAAFGHDAAPTDTPRELAVDDAARAWATEWLGRTETPRPIVGLHLGAAFGPSKRWPVDRFRGTLDILRDRLGAFTALVVGGPDEAAAAEELRQDIPGITVLPAAGATPGIPELAALIERCDVFLSNDSGPMHVAAALRKPQVAVFTSTCPAFTAPWNPQAVVVAADVPCSPCFARQCRRAQGHIVPCHDAITAHQVADAVATLIENHPSDSKTTS